MTTERVDKLFLALMPVASTVLGLLLGNYLTLHNSQSLYKIQRQTEAREHAYVRLEGASSALHFSVEVDLGSTATLLYMSRTVDLDEAGSIESKMIDNAVQAMPKSIDRLMASQSHS